MSRPLTLIAIGAIAGAGAATVAVAQPPGAEVRGRPVPGPQAEVTAYLRPNYQGPQTSYTGPVDRAPVTLMVGSLRVRGAWQFCSGPSFTGACTTTDRDAPNFAVLGLRSIGSFRPVNNGPFPPSPSGPPLPPPERGDNQNLRGVKATFFPRPAERGYRVEVDNNDRGDRGERGRGPGRGGFDRPPSSQDVERAADRFCRTSGYAEADAYDVEQVNRRFYLADVLCTRDR